MEQTRQSKRHRVSPDPVFPILHPVPVSSVPPTGTTQNRLSKRRRLDPDPDRLFPNLRPVRVQDTLVLPNAQGAQQASQTHPTNSKSNEGQNRQSKRRRLNPDPLFPTLRPEQASPEPMTNRVQHRNSQLSDSTTIDIEEISRELPRSADCLKCRGASEGKRPCQASLKYGIKGCCICGILPSMAKSHIPKPQETRLPLANSLEGLPTELQLMIFDFLPDLDTFDALVYASLIYHWIFAYHPFEHIFSRLSVLVRNIF